MLYDVLQKLNKEKCNYFSGKINEIDYLKSCYDIICGIIKEYKNITVGWQAFAFCQVDNYGNFFSFPPFVIDDNRKRSFIDFFERTKQQIIQNEATSITSYVVNKPNIQGVLFYKTNKKNIEDDYSYINLAKINIDDSIDTKKIIQQAKEQGIIEENIKEEEEKKFIELVDSHQEHSKNFENFYEFWIRPIIPHNKYDGIVIIFTESPLKEFQYSMLSLFLTFILSDIAIEKLSKDAEWKTIVDEMSHHNHHVYGAIKDYEDKAKAFILKEKSLTEEAKKEYERLYTPAEKTRELLARTNDFLLALNKKSIDANVELSDTLESTLEKTTFSLLKLIQEVFTIIEATHKDLGFNRVGLRKISFEKFQTVKQQSLEYYKENDVEVCNNYEGAFICLLELVKNAIRYSDSVKPKFNISHILKIDKLLIKISNNKLMTKEDFNCIKTLGQDCANSNITKASFGLRTVFRIILSPLNTSEYGYKIECEQNTVEKTTHFYFTIPLT